MPQITQYHNVLWSKLKPSVDIQARGSSNIPIRSSSTFGPQLNKLNWTDWSHRQSTTLTNALNRMNQ
jgi:hypothetical protein